jgi:hypothetical protein
MRVKITAVAFLLFILTFAGCAPTVSYVPFTSDTYPPATENQIKVYQCCLPDLPFEEIGGMEVRGKLEKAVKAMKHKAAQRGADAIILGQESESIGAVHRYRPYTGSTEASRRAFARAGLGGPIMIPSKSKTYRATAIKFITK